MKQLTMPFPIKIRYLQLKAVATLSREQPNLMEPLASQLQYEILPNYLKLTAEEETLASEDVVEFLSKEEEFAASYSNLKKAASEGWVVLAELGSKVSTKKTPYVEGKFFQNNMLYLKSKLEGGNPIETEMAMKLICDLRLPIKRSK